MSAWCIHSLCITSEERDDTLIVLADTRRKGIIVVNKHTDAGRGASIFLLPPVYEATSSRCAWRPPLSAGPIVLSTAT